MKEFPLKTRIDIETSLSVITTAFLPLRCVTEEWDAGERIRFRVFDGDEPVLRVDELVKALFSDPSRLKGVLGQARSTLISRGIALNAWEFADGE